jgi:2-polyprenyl-3-methyl-5-hydroxy-6-metoxy-1,4-benzoquinol methylase
MPETIPKPPTGTWPESGLERVTACPACGSDDRSVLYENLEDRTFFCAPGQWTLQRCKACESVYLNPRPTPDTIGDAYARYYTHGEQRDWSEKLGRVWTVLKQLRNAYLNSRYGYALETTWPVWVARLVPLMPSLRYRFERTVRWLPHLSSKPRLLDVGCGNGEFLTLMRDFGWTVTGLEPDPQACEFATARGLEVHQGTLADVCLESDQFDAITLSHVIEHLHDPLSDLKACLRLLRPGGVLVVITPNTQSVGHSRYGRHWRGLETPRHLTVFNLSSLTGLLERAGFSIPPLPMQPLMAMGYFRLSRGILLGLDPQIAPNLPFFEKILAFYANLLCLISPGRAEEIVAVAQKLRKAGKIEK